jgi:hypothetical protein
VLGLLTVSLLVVGPEEPRVAAAAVQVGIWNKQMFILQQELRQSLLEQEALVAVPQLPETMATQVG